MSDIVWKGDLDDDCTAVFDNYVLRAVRMGAGEWWWAVESAKAIGTRIIGDRKIVSASDTGYWPATGELARAKAEKVARAIAGE